MPTYIYTGAGASLSIAGRTLYRGQPTELDGRAAASAEGHPDVEPYAAPGAGPQGPTYADLQQRAKALGIPVRGKAAELAEAIAAEEARLKAEAGGSGGGNGAD